MSPTHAARQSLRHMLSRQGLLTWGKPLRKVAARLQQTPKTTTSTKSIAKPGTLGSAVPRKAQLGTSRRLRPDRTRCRP